MLVTKRNGETQQHDLDKIHQVLEWACNGENDDALERIKGVSVSAIEMRANLHFYDGMPTSEIHECLIKSAAELINEDTPNYDRVAARLRWFAVRKEAFGDNLPPALIEVVKMNTENGKYDPNLLDMYSKEEWDYLNSVVDHRRDDLFRFAGAEQMAKKYLVQDRKTKKVYETFQIPYILVAAILFHKYPKETRLKYVKQYYDAISQHYISLPTPIMSGLRTRVKQFSSCTVIDVGDSLTSITAGAGAIVEYASRKAGIGLNIGRIRAAGQSVRGGDAVTTGILPFSKLFAAALKSCSQGAVRGASATFNYPMIHLEFETLIELKNNKGTEETRLRTVDYCVHLNKTLYERLVGNSHITLFSPDEVPDLFDAFYGPADAFKVLYEKYEADPSKTKKTINARAAFTKLMQERFETGRIYIMNADHVNTHGPFYEPVKMTNLCLSGDSWIETNQGQWKMRDLYTNSLTDLKAISDSRAFVGRETLSSYSAVQPCHFRSITKVVKTGDSVEVVRVQVESGQSLILTPTHEVMTVRGWVQAKDLIVGKDQVYTNVFTQELGLLQEYCRRGSVSTVLSVSPAGTTDVYDLTVEDSHSFIANGIVVHNCVEIALPTTPIGDDESLVSLCTLSAVNVGLIETHAQMVRIGALAVRGLDALLDYQDYPNEAARRATMRYRPLGIGVIGFAHFLAKEHLVWGSRECLERTSELVESMAWSLTKASADLAEEQGACPGKTKYHGGILPMDTSIIPANPKLNWEPIRQKLIKYGIRNSTLMAGMPSETSSQLANETNGFEPPKDLITIKGSKDGVMAQVVPEFSKLGPWYQRAWDISVPDYLNTVAQFQIWFDQSLSTNTTYNPSKGAITMGVLMQDLLLAYKLGIKTLYYNNTLDGAGEDMDDGCAGGACKI